MTTKAVKFTFITLTGLLITSCSNFEDTPNLPEKDNSNQTTTPADSLSQIIRPHIAAFAETGQDLPEESSISTLDACLFENGKIKNIYTNLTGTEGNYSISTSSTGNLYMVANTHNAINLSQLLADSISEDTWKKQVITASSGKQNMFFGGMITLNGAATSATPQPITLVRGLARFDLSVNVSGSASIKSVTFTNLAQSGYLFAQADTAVSPQQVLYRDTTVTFPAGLSHSQNAILYAYEQANAGVEVKVEVAFDGHSTQTLTGKMEGGFKRNHIYTITVKKEDIDITVHPTIEDWQQGEGIEITPSDHSSNYQADKQ